MRILFAFVGGNGHFEPLVPVAQAAQAAGHEAAFACGPSMVETVRAGGFTPLAIGEGSGTPPPRLPLLVVDMEREERDLRERFARDAAGARASGVLALAKQWQPQVIVCDEVDFGSMIAAERLGIPHATVLVIAAGSFVRPDVVGEPLEALRAKYGLPPDPQLSMLSRYLVLAPFPPSFRDPAFPLPDTAFAIRPHTGYTENSSALFDLAAGPAEQPLVYFTLGTIFNTESGDLFERVLAGLRELPIRLIVTVGKYIDPVEFGPQPPHVRIERYIPQGQLLPHCRVAVSHGGSGSVTGALAHGVPLVLLPMGADQPLNAARCEALGVGRALDPVAAAPEDVREAVLAVLEDPSYADAARQLRDECAALPGPEVAVGLLERLAVERRPLLSL